MTSTRKSPASKPKAERRAYRGVRLAPAQSRVAGEAGTPAALLSDLHDPVALGVVAAFEAEAQGLHALLAGAVGEAFGAHGLA